MIPEQARYIMKKLRENGYEAYLVGGCVRDTVMGRPVHDWDITTSALPQDCSAIFNALGHHVIETGLKHGTITVALDKVPYEITTYRIDGDYADHRHPDTVRFSKNVRDDLSRRDFTVNAMIMDEDGNVTDLFGGKQDIKDRIIRCVGDPEKRFDEDGLRILRALRFSSVLDFSLSPDVCAAIRKKKDLLKEISAERIYAELCRLVTGPGAGRILAENSEVLGVFMPQILPCVGFDQQNRHHDYDVWTHTCRAVGASVPELNVRLALLFHDLGKPETFTKDEKGGHFYGHHEYSAKHARDIMNALRADHATRDAVVTLVELHDTVFSGGRKQLHKLLCRIGPQRTRELLQVHRADVAAQSETCREERLAQADGLFTILDELLEQENCFSLKDMAVNGTDLVNLGAEPGPVIGQILKHLFGEITEGRLKNDREVLMKEAGRMIRGGREER